MIEAKILAFIFGSVVGSFLNVCIYRMPLGKSVVWPHSHCPKCEKKIPWYDNLPFISYLFLRGRCRFCKERISLRYLVVELLTALAFVVLYNLYGLKYEFFIYAIFVCNLIIASFVDIKHRIIPDEVSIGGMIVGFVLSAIKGFNLAPFSYNIKPMLDSLLGIIIGGGIIYLTGFLFDLVYFKLLKKPPIQGETESMGGGDVKLLAMIGAFLGWQGAVLTFFIAPLFGAVIGIINLIVKKEHLIPYGPFLSLAALVSLFWADKIIRLIFIQ
ncbi:MAG: prepilin peptidase [Candidatus Omnitrophica bacterium]|nr:prepilin peptidase [Candidatus Omnitrophota bacterium]